MKCDKCGKDLAIGDWPFCSSIGGHEKMLTYRPFEAYFDWGLGETVTSTEHRNKLMKRHNSEVVREPVDTESAKRDFREYRMERVRVQKERALERGGR